MSKRTMTSLAIFAVLAALVLSGCYRTPEQRAEYFVKKMTSELKLDDTQRAKLEKIKDDFLARRPDMAKQREETLKEANELMRSTEIDKAKLDALVKRSEGEVDGMVKFISEKFTEIHDMLTPEQREKLVSHIEKHMGHMHERAEAERPAVMGNNY